MRAYLTMLPRLRAEEMLEASNAMALGSGALRPMEAARLRRELMRQTGGRSAVPATPMALAAMGIAVTVVEPKNA